MKIDVNLNKVPAKSTVNRRTQGWWYNRHDPNAYTLNTPLTSGSSGSSGPSTGSSSGGIQSSGPSGLNGQAGQSGQQQQSQQGQGQSQTETKKKKKSNKFEPEVFFYDPHDETKAQVLVPYDLVENKTFEVLRAINRCGKITRIIKEREDNYCFKIVPWVNGKWGNYDLDKTLFLGYDPVNRTNLKKLKLNMEHEIVKVMPLTEKQKKNQWDWGI